MSESHQPVLFSHEWRWVLTRLVALGPLALAAGAGIGMFVDLPGPGTPPRSIPSIGVPATTAAPRPIVTVTTASTPKPTPRATTPRPAPAPPPASKPRLTPSPTPTPTPTPSATPTPSPTTTPEGTPSETSSSPPDAGSDGHQQQAGDHLS